jgi:TM2 domain-containing membrane protein YozV
MADSAKGGEGKSQLIALILCGVIGGLGVHRFYLGYIWQGVVQLLTLGGCGIWTLIDFVRIIMGSLTPKDGEYGTTL